MKTKLSVTVLKKCHSILKKMEKTMKTVDTFEVWTRCIQISKLLMIVQEIKKESCLLDSIYFMQ
jgi:hypothetical protein